MTDEIKMHPIQTVDGLKRLWKIGVETGRILQGAETGAATPKPPAGGDAGAVEREKIREALTPFAQWADWYEGMALTDEAVAHGMGRINAPPSYILVGDLRRARAILAALSLPAPVVEGEVEKLREEVTRLRKIAMPLWFYPADGHESDSCMWSVDEVIDYADLPPGDHVVEVNAATPLPSIWCAVRVTADEDADERHTFTEHDSAAAARAALSEGRSHG